MQLKHSLNIDFCNCIRNKIKKNTENVFKFVKYDV